jgi:hypothetical protein
MSEQAGIAVTLQTSLRKVIGSNHGWDIGYAVISLTPPTPHREIWVRHIDYVIITSFRIYPNSLLTSHPTVRCYAIQNTDNIVKEATKRNIMIDKLTAKEEGQQFLLSDGDYNQCHLSLLLSVSEVT